MGNSFVYIKLIGCKMTLESAWHDEKLYQLILILACFVTSKQMLYPLNRFNNSIISIRWNTPFSSKVFPLWSQLNATHCGKTEEKFSSSFDWDWIPTDCLNHLTSSYFIPGFANSVINVFDPTIWSISKPRGNGSGGITLFGFIPLINCAQLLLV